MQYGFCPANLELQYKMRISGYLETRIPLRGNYIGQAVRESSTLCVYTYVK